MVESLLEKAFRLACPYRKLQPALFMVKSSQDRSYSNLTKSLNGTTGRGILAKCQMCPDVVVVGGIASEDPAQVGFAEDDDVIEAFPTDRTDQPLRVPVLPG